MTPSQVAHGARRHATMEHGSGTLADLIADARAIPMAAFGVSRAASRHASRVAAHSVIDLTGSARRAVITIPDAAADLMHRAEQTFADYLR